jgi:hypothetical protein
MHGTAGTKDSAAVLAAAELFHAFVMSDSKPMPAPMPAPNVKDEPPKAAPKTTAAPKAAPPKAEPKKTAAKPPEEVAADKLLDEEEAEAPAATKKDVSAAIVKLINGGQRDAAVKLLADHGAESLGALDPEHYGSVVAQAAELLG